VVKDNLTMMMIIVIVISFLPALREFIRVVVHIVCKLTILNRISYFAGLMVN